MSEVRATAEWLFREIKTYNFFDFKSQLKIGLSFVGTIHLVYRSFQNAKTSLHGHKIADFFEINPITVIFCKLSRA